MLSGAKNLAVFARSGARLPDEQVISGVGTFSQAQGCLGLPPGVRGEVRVHHVH